MKALYFIGNQTMELRNVPEPSPGEGEYLIRVVANGICGSDFDGYMGRSGRRIPPMIMGHEVSGIVEKAPPGGQYAAGQKVVIFPKDYCGTCDFCKKDMVNVCPNGICMGVMTRDGSMTEYLAVAEKYLLPFGGPLSFDTATLTEPLAVAKRSVGKLSDAEVAAAKHCVVIGAGTIGLLAAGLLKLRGAKDVIVSDTSAFRLQTALRMGADRVVNSREADFAGAIKELTGGAMCDFSIEAVGLQPTVSDSLEALRIGGTTVWIGNAQRIVEVNMQKVVTTELTIRGNYVYGLEDFRSSLRLLEEGKIDGGPVITHKRRLADGVSVFKELENNREGKMLKVILES